MIPLYQVKYIEKYTTSRGLSSIPVISSRAKFNARGLNKSFCTDLDMRLGVVQLEHGIVFY